MWLKGLIFTLIMVLMLSFLSCRPPVDETEENAQQGQSAPFVPDEENQR